MCRTFNETNHYQLTHIGPIDVDTILKLDAANGKVLNSWGASLFYFPHGMTIDHNGNIWVTDVALHQVFKFKPKSRYPSITIGRRFQPGSIPSQLCKPTAVSVATTGEVYILLLYICLHSENSNSSPITSTLFIYELFLVFIFNIFCFLNKNRFLLLMVTVIIGF